VKVREYFYPGFDTLGVSPVDGSVEFYARVNRVMPASSTVLDFGAGRGRQFEDVDPWWRDLLLLRPKCQVRVGCDVDPTVKNNPYLEQAYVLRSEDDYRIPLPDGSVDVVLADWVIEHLQDPSHTFREIHRVLAPGGWFCARTGNLFHYSYALARLIGNTALGKRLLAIAQPGRAEQDVFPKVMAVNTRRALRRSLRNAGFAQITIVLWESEPAYLNFHPIAFAIGAIYERGARVGVLPRAELLSYARK
jgi:SAM-dependent methyltransferase